LVPWLAVTVVALVLAAVATAGATTRRSATPARIRVAQAASLPSGVSTNLPPAYTINPLPSPAPSGAGQSRATSVSNSGAIVGFATDAAGDDMPLRPMSWAPSGFGAKTVYKATQLSPLLAPSPSFLMDGGGATVLGANAPYDICSPSCVAEPTLSVADVGTAAHRQNAQLGTPAAAGSIFVKGVSRAAAWSTLTSSPSDAVANYTSTPDPCNPNPTASGDRGCAATGIDTDGDVVGFIGGAASSMTETPFLHSESGTNYTQSTEGIGDSAIASAVSTYEPGGTTGPLIVGCQTSGGDCDGAVSWQGVNAPPVKIPGGANGQATAVNANGLIVGYGINPSTGSRTAWTYDTLSGASVTWLPRVSGYISEEARGVSAWGLTVGWGFDANGKYHALWWENGEAHDLNDALNAVDKTKWTLERAYGVNDRGDIVGVGLYGGRQTGFVMRVAPTVFVPGVASSFLNRSSDNKPEWLACGQILNRGVLNLSTAMYATDAFRFATCPVLPSSLPELDGDGTFLAALGANGYREYNSVAQTASDVGKRTTKDCDTSQRENGPNLFVFAYDWRQDIGDTHNNDGLADQLNDFIGCIERFYGDGRGITAIGHSMGNLVVRRYEIAYPTDPHSSGPNPVTTFLSINPPWWGATKLLYVALTGDFLAPMATGSSLKTAIQSMYAPLELHPSKKLVDSFGGAVVTTHSLSSNGTNVATRLDFSHEQTWIKPLINPPAGRDILSLVNNLHDVYANGAQDDFSNDGPAVRHIEYYGVQQKGATVLKNTIGPVDYWPNHYVCNKGGCHDLGPKVDTSETAGDGTVPLDSLRLGADDRFLSKNFVMYKCAGPPSESFLHGNDGIEHTLMLRNTEVINDALNSLRGLPVMAGAQCALDPAHTTASGPMITPPSAQTQRPSRTSSRSDAASDPDDYTTFWNLDGAGVTGLAVTDESGDTSSTALSPAASVPGVSIDVPDSSDVAAQIPASASHTYTVSFTSDGLGTGIRLITDANSGKSARWQDLAMPSGAVGTFTIAPTGVSSLKYTANGATTTVAHVTATGAASQDVTPPTVAICKQTQGSQSTFAVHASDPGDTVSEVEYSTDGTNFKSYSAPLSLNPSTTPQLWAWAEDDHVNRSPVVTENLASLAAPGLSITGDAVSGTSSNATATVQLPCASTSTVTVHYATSDGTAKAGTDYSSTSGTLTFAPGDTVKTVSIPITNDPKAENDITLTVNLSAASGAPIVTNSAVVTIGYDRTFVPPQASVGATSVTQPLTGTATVNVPVSLSAAVTKGVTVSYATKDGTAKNGVDYTPKTGSVTIPAGKTTANVPVTVLAAPTPHAERTFTVTLSNPVNATLGVGVATVTVKSQSPPAPPVLAGSAGSGQDKLTWTAPSPGTSPISGYTVYRGTTSGAEAKLASVPAGTTTYPDSAVVNGTSYSYEVTAASAAGEGARSNEVTLKPSAGSQVPGQPILTATSATGAAKLAWTVPTPGADPISGYMVLRGESTGHEVPLAQLGASATSYTDQSVTNGLEYYYEVEAVNAAGQGPPSNEGHVVPAAAPSAPALTAMPGSAVAHLRWETPSSSGGDPVTAYKVLRGTATGAESALATVTGGATHTYDDSSVTNGTKYFYEVEAVSAAGTSAASTEASATPSASAKPSVYVPDVTATASATSGATTTMSVPVSLSAPAAGSVSVELFTQYVSSANPGSDYVPTDTMVTFPAGTTTENVPVTVLGKSTYQSPVTIGLDVGTVTAGYPIGRSVALGTIDSGVAAPAVSIGAASGNENQSSLVFPVTLSKASATDTTVMYTTADGSAHAPGDYTAESGTLTIAPGHTSASITVPIVNHDIAAAQATLQVVLFDPAGATLGSDTAVGTITGSGATACTLANKVSWTGAANDGLWSSPGNWSTSSVPGATANVCIATGSGVTVDKPESVASVESDIPLTIDAKLALTSTSQDSTFKANTTLSGPMQAELDIAGTLDVSGGTFTWGDPSPVASMGWISNISGKGTMVVHSGATFVVEAGECNARLSSQAATDLFGCAQFTPALRNDGTVTVATGNFFRDSTQPWTNTGTLNLAENTADSNGVSTIMGGCHSDPDSSWGISPCNRFTLTNTGSINRPSGPNSSTIENTLLANTGTVNLAGSLKIEETTSWTATLAGTWKVTKGATLDFSGPGTLTLPAGAAMSGAGTLALTYNSQLTMNLAGSFSLPNLTDSGARITADSAMTLNTLNVTNGGVLTGPGSVTLPQITPAATANLVGGTISLKGGLTADSTAVMNWNSGGTWAGTGTLTIMPGATLNLADTTLTSGSVVNEGTVAWHTGALLANGGTFQNSGTIDLAPTNSGNTPDLDAVGSGGKFTFTNSGLLNFNGGSDSDQAEIDGYTSRIGSINANSGTLFLKPPTGVTAGLGSDASVGSGATLDLEGANTGVGGSSPGGFVLAAGSSLTGAGTLAVGINGTGTVAGLPVELAGTDGLPKLSVGSLNPTVKLDQALSLSAFSVLTGGSVTGAGSVTIPSGGSLSLAGSFTGSGDLTLASGSSGSWLTGGLMGGSGTTTVASGVTLNMPMEQVLGAAGTLGRPLVNDGTVKWSGGVVAEVAGGSWQNAGTLDLDPASAGSVPYLEDDAAGDAVFTNAAAGKVVVSVSGGASAAVLGGVVSSAGSVTVASGTLVLQPPAGVTASLAGGASVASKATLDLEGAFGGSSPGGFALPSSAAFTGTGELDVGLSGANRQAGLPVELAGSDGLPKLSVGSLNPTVKLDQALSLSKFSELFGGTVTGAGSVTVVSGGTGDVAGSFTGSGNLTWASGSSGGLSSNGTMGGTGTTTVASGATVSMSNLPSVGMTLGRAFVNDGTVNWSDGTVTEAPGGSFRNAGALNLDSSGGPGLSAANDSDHKFGFTNASGGTITLAHTGTGPGSGAVLEGVSGSDGKIVVNSGTLTLKPGPGVTASLPGGASVASGATLELAGADGGSSAGGFLLPSGASLTGAGSLTAGDNVGNAQPGLAVELAGTDALPALSLGTLSPTVNIDANSLELSSYSQSSGATLVTTLASATSYGSITTSGKSTIDGILDIALGGTYSPAVGAQFNVVQATGGLTGTFATINSPTGKSFAAGYTATTATLTRSG
jgi:hypothetical protein